MTHRFDTPGQVAVRADLQSAELEVLTWAEPLVQVELDTFRDTEGAREALRAFRVELRERPSGGHEVVIEEPDRSLIRRGLRLGKEDLRVRVHCPEGSRLECRARTSDVRCRGALGDVELRLGSGDVGLELAGGVTVHAASGDVAVREAAGAVSVTTASGDIHIGRAEAGVNANLVSGDLFVDDVRGPLAVTTVSGDVVVRLAAAGDIRVQSVSGDVSVGVGEGQRLWLDVSTVSGSASSDLDLSDDAPTEGDETVEVRIRTVSGDVNVTRAAAAAR